MRVHLQATFMTEGGCKRRCWINFVLMLMAHLVTEGLIGSILRVIIYWVRDVPFSGIGCTVLAAKGDLAFALVLMLPWIGCPLHSWCERLVAVAAAKGVRCPLRRSGPATLEVEGLLGKVRGSAPG